jgi:hypothetical protein
VAFQSTRSHGTPRQDQWLGAAPPRSSRMSIRKIRHRTSDSEH